MPYDACQQCNVQRVWSTYVPVGSADLGKWLAIIAKPPSRAAESLSVAGDGLSTVGYAPT
jgi:hypothetical protein